MGPLIAAAVEGVVVAVSALAAQAGVKKLARHQKGMRRALRRRLHGGKPRHGRESRPKAAPTPTVEAPTPTPEGYVDPNMA
jgi:hypothetical protein